MILFCSLINTTILVCQSLRNNKDKLEKGFIFGLYPKYHCECNWIEKYWGAAKREARQNCDYSFSSLDANVNNFLDSVCPPGEVPEKIRRYSNKSSNYIYAYSQDKDVHAAMEVVKRFSKLERSHRKLRENQ